LAVSSSSSAITRAIKSTTVRLEPTKKANVEEQGEKGARNGTFHRFLVAASQSKDLLGDGVESDGILVQTLEARHLPQHFDGCTSPRPTPFK
jgi:hypothetical protein